MVQENLEKELLTRFQFKAARIATRLSQEKLGKILGLSQSTIYDFEQKSNTDFISCKKLELKNIILFFTENGVVFSDYLTITLAEDPQILLNKEK
jgi:DNA-binding XRE family transcriptional regulator